VKNACYFTITARDPLLIIYNSICGNITCRDMAVFSLFPLCEVGQCPFGALGCALWNKTFSKFFHFFFISKLKPGYLTFEREHRAQKLVAAAGWGSGSWNSWYARGFPVYSHIPRHWMDFAKGQAKVSSSSMTFLIMP